MVLLSTRLRVTLPRILAISRAFRGRTLLLSIASTAVCKALAELDSSNMKPSIRRVEQLDHEE
jgi:hypothetical protein